MAFNPLDPTGLLGKSGLFGGGGKKKDDDWSYDPSKVLGGSGFTLDPGAAPGGFPYPIQSGYAEAGRVTLQGTELASQALIGGYEELFRTRTEGAKGRLREQERFYAGEAASQGLDEGTVRQLGLLGQLTAGSEINQAEGESRSQALLALSQLLKGTGTELAGLKLSQVQTFLDYILGEKARAAAESASKKGLWGAALGAGGNVLGGALAGG